VGQTTLVESQIDDGLNLIEQLARDGFEVSAAGWVKQYEADWFLYIVSPVVDADGIAKAYRRVQTALRGMPEPFWVDPFDVKLIGPGDRLARAMVDVQSRYPGKTPIRTGGRLGDSFIEEAYLYPKPVPSTRP
jgi:hypothetical protein